MLDALCMRDGVEGLVRRFSYFRRNFVSGDASEETNSMA